MGLLGPLVGRLFDAFGPRPLAIPGAALLTLVMFGFSRLQSDTPVWWIVTLQISMSVGLALIFTPAFTSGLNPLPPQLWPIRSTLPTKRTPDLPAGEPPIMVG